MTFKVTTVLFSGSNGVDDGRSNGALKIKKGDITQWFVDGSSDAIVNSANKGMLGGGGADGGTLPPYIGLQDWNSEKLVTEFQKSDLESDVRQEKRELPRRLFHFVILVLFFEYKQDIKIVKLCRGFKLPASRVIHTVGPNYGVDNNPEAALRNAYKNSLSLAKVNNIQYIAFPAISCGLYGYPHEEAATIAISTVKEYAYDFKEVHFVLFTDDIYSVWLKTAKKLLEE